MNRRFERTFLKIQDIIASGVLGQVYMAKLRRGAFQRRADWQTIKEFGGGQLLNWGPHIIDQALQLLGTEPVEMWSDLKNIAALGDAEDHVHIILKNSTGMVVDLEISGGRITKESEYLITGTKGSLEATGSTINLRYLDPQKPLKKRRPRRSTPPQEGGFGAKEELLWIEEEIKVSPESVDTDSIWDRLYNTVREGQPFPISLEQAVAVMEIVSKAKKDTPFGNIQ